MSPDDARALLLLQSFENPLTPVWRESDRDWASREASRREGESAPDERWLVSRARLAVKRLTERHPILARVLIDSTAFSLPGGLLAGLIALAFTLGVATDLLRTTHRINLLDLPLVGLMVWNLAIFALLVLKPLLGDHLGAALRAPVEKLGHILMTVWQKIDESLRVDAALHSETTALAGPLARFTANWSRLNAPREEARLIAGLHAAAAALALGLLASLYWRGLVNEYRAGWDSTFLSPQEVHHLLSLALWPALKLSGTTLPDANTLATLRFSVGPGENAAKWIHLQAWTVLVIVVLPRAVLACLAWRRTRHLATDLPVALDSPDLQSVLRTRRGERIRVRVLPYGYHMTGSLRAGLQCTLEREFDSGVDLDLAETLPLGSEDEPARWRLEAGASPAAAVLPLFALTATPERETHGAFIEALGVDRSNEPRRLILIDESGFRERGFDAARLTQRRAAWQRMIDALGCVALFADLSEPSPDRAAWVQKPRPEPSSTSVVPPRP
jgi:hypothetical protein